MDPEQKSIKKRNRGHNKKICFSEETVTRDAAKTLLAQKPTEKQLNGSSIEESVSEDIGINKPKSKAKKRKQKVSTENAPMNNNDDDSVSIKPKKKKRNEQTQGKTNENDNPEEEDGSGTKKPDNSVSKRSLKRMKKQQIEETRKAEYDVDSQKKALNYLSNWKYNKSEWKFEKLRQVWLVQNLYNSNKIDDKFWDTLVEYFTSSQGTVRKKMLDEAIKIVENDEIKSNEEVKYNRARDIVQNL